MRSEDGRQMDVKEGDGTGWLITFKSADEGRETGGPSMLPGISLDYPTGSGAAQIRMFCGAVVPFRSAGACKMHNKPWAR